MATQPVVTPPDQSAVSAVPGTIPVGPARRGLRVGNYLTVLLFAGPALVLIAFLVIYPTIKTIYLSFYQTQGIGFNAPQAFVGLANYSNFLNDPIIQTAIKNNILWIVVVTPATVILGVVLAVLFDRVPYEAVAKSIVFVPMAISATAAGVIWRLMYADDPHIGTVNAIFGWIHLGPFSFLGDPNFVNWALFGAQVWMSLGFAVVVLSAALKSIPTELMEAAHLDGAGEWQTFIRITVPLMWPTITVIATLTMIAVIKVFDIVVVMTGGGPAGASEVLATRMYTEAFKNVNTGYGAAIAVVLLIAVIPVMALNIRRFRTETVR
ncbi:MAG TPA: sugar ABC transporter permease [Chloroflexota bacterium]|nr:sugar ABC transporter permease [Chloroflexota bacterium]